ncbi:phage head closure protein [Candidimonas humi]|uniref:Phage head closure protein n=1 Tax=Candidimonas humi TaxID=683355 RepID=A0ABV8NUH9_9BURK|nr:phage head closure protein [Candidimonas humi]MBV6304934.1 phage head closure protein [Candidimonas humi]
MQAGKLNRRITIQQKVAGQSTSGQPISTWEDFAKVWANIAGATGMASIRQTANQGNVAASINSYSFRIRYRTDITDAMRVLYSGLIFDIKQVRLDLAGHDRTDLVCEQGGSQG